MVKSITISVRHLTLTRQITYDQPTANIIPIST